LNGKLRVKMRIYGPGSWTDEPRVLVGGGG